MQHNDDDNGPPTPRVRPSACERLDLAVELQSLLSSAAMAFAKRPDVGHDLAAARRCRVLAANAGLLADGFDSWTRCPPTDEERAYDLDALAQLVEEARPYLTRIGLWQ